MKRVFLAICGSLVIVACGGGGGGGGYNPPSSPTTIIVTISPTAQTDIDAGEVVKFAAAVENDSSAKGVTWSCSGTSPVGTSCGTFTSITANGATYNAPPSVSANLSITVTATSAADTTKTASATVLVSPPPSIKTTTLSDATESSSYNAALQVAGGVAPLTWFVASGAMPAGLSLSSSGDITGEPSASGNFNFTVQVTDSSTAAEGGPATAQALISLTVDAGMKISTTSLPAGTSGVAYQAQVVATGGARPYTWSLTKGSEPPGLTLQPSSGVISGMPTTPGTFSFTVEATDSSSTPQCQTQTLTLTISAPGPLTITTSSLSNATPNINYSASLQANGGIAPLAWSLASGSLPTGLSLTSSGIISGDPTVPGSFTFAVQVIDSCPAQAGGPATVQAQLSITVVSLIDITTASLPAGTEGSAYLDQIEASGGTPPYTWSVVTGSLPAGITLQTSSGAISGSPSATGNFSFQIRAIDSSPTPQAATQALSITIGSPAPLSLATQALLDGMVNTPYNAMMAATGGTPPYTWSIQSGPLPSNISLNGKTGAMAGTPLTMGVSDFTVKVVDSSSVPQTQTQALSLTIKAAAAACTSSGIDSVLNGPYAFSLSGFTDLGFISVVGSFTADGTGRVTAGEVDTNGILGAQHGNINISASSYSVGLDNRGCATLATSFGSFTTRFDLESISSNIAASGRMVEWDSPSSSAFIAAGQLLRQDLGSIADGLSGSYAFRTIGWDPSAQGGREVCVGALSTGGNTLSGLEQDCNDAWNILSIAVPNVAGTYTSLDASGRGTAIVSTTAANSNLTFYAVSSSKLLVVNADPGPFLSGEWDQQSVPASGAGFTQASLKGNMVFYLNGLSMEGTASTVSVETATADGNSLLAINFYEDRAGATQSSIPLTCTYAVEPSGRVFLSSDTQSCGSNTPVIYLTSANSGFIMDAAPGVDTGSVEPQSAGPFSNSSLQGTYAGGIDEAVLQTVQSEVDLISPSVSGSMSGTNDMISATAQDADASVQNSPYTINPDGTITTGSQNGVVTGVMISASKFVIFSPSTQATLLPTLLVMQQ